MRNLFILWCAIVFFCSASSSAADWPHWRGPGYDGSTEAENLPDTFGPEENILWAIDMPGSGAATPIIVGQQVYITSFDEASKNVIGVSYDLNTGEKKWQITLGPGRDPGPHGIENWNAACSPVSDTERIIFFTGNGDLVACSHDGDELWRRNIQKDYGKFNTLWGYASSPLLHENKLYVQVLHQIRGRGEKNGQAESYLLVIDPLTGETLHRQVRKTDAPGETKDSYATPIPYTVNGQTQILILGADQLTGHDAQTGEELWRYGDWNPRGVTHWRHVQSPTVGPDGKIYVTTPKEEPIRVIEINNNQPREIWTTDQRGVTNDVTTPLYYDGRLYILNGKKKVLSCLNPEDGKVIWTHRFDCLTYFRASPTAADGKIYLINADGEAYIMAAGDESKQLHHTKLGGYPSRASIALADNKIFIRTSDKLYCIGHKN